MKFNLELVTINIWRAGKYAAGLVLLIQALFLVSLLSLWGKSGLEPLVFANPKETVTRWVMFSSENIMRNPPAKKQIQKATPALASLTLRGIIGSGLEGVALIQVRGPKLEIFRVGDRVTDNWRIVRLSNDSAILGSANEEYILPLKLFAVSTSPANSKASSGAAAVDSDERFGLKVVRNRSGAKGLALADVPSAVLEELGLERGDIVLTVEDIDASEIYDTPEQFQHLIGLPEWRITLVRNGRETSVSLGKAALLNVVSELGK